MTEFSYRKYQTFSQRIGATIIDGIVFIPIYFMASAIFSDDYDDSFLGVIFINTLSYSYSIVAHHRFGQTIGKYCFSVKVVQNTDESKLLTLSQALKRDLIGIGLVILDIMLKILKVSDTGWGNWVSFLAGFGWLIAEIVTMLINKKRRSIHDYIANAVCIDIAKHRE